MKIMRRSTDSFIHKPVAAFRVGITGSRALRPKAVAALRSRVAEVLRQVKAGVDRCARSDKATGAYQPGPARLRLLSPLAEGADRLVADEAVALGYELYAPMPFAQAEYEKDFPDSIVEFRRLLAEAGPRVLALDGGRGDDEARSYEAVGRLVVRNCDLLIAIWDGGKGRGRGGSADIARYAAHYGLPIWWLHVDGEAEPRWIENTYQLDRPHLAKSDDAARAALDDYLAATMILEPEPLGAAESLITGMLLAVRRHWPAGVERNTPLALFFAETPRPRRPIWTIHKHVMRWAAGRQPIPHPADEIPPPTGEVWSYWQSLYAPVDRLAVDYANRYRTSYVLIFAMAAIALICAVIALGMHPAALVATSTELLLLVAISAIVGVNGLRYWHGRLIVYRLLAELFRKQQALALLAWSLPSAETSRVSGDADDMAATSPRDALVGWYFNAALRAAPLPQGVLGVTALAEVCHAVRASLIAGQVEYHDRRRRESHAAAKRFGRIGELFFLFTLVLVVAKCAMLVWRAINGTSEAATGMTDYIEGVGFCAALLPILSAAFVGIRGYAELELLADQAAQMQHAMARGDARLHSVTLNVPLASQDLGAELLALAESMLLDIKGWAQLFRVKAVEPG
jgi:hypothetical protein